MNKIFVLCCSFLITFCAVYATNPYSTTSVVTIVGGIIKSTQHQEDVEKKYPRKNCPVCKGKGWYMSGDDISKILCQYCEPE